MEPRVNTVFVKNFEGKDIIRVVKRNKQLSCYTMFNVMKYLAIIDFIDDIEGAKVFSVNYIDEKNGLVVIKLDNNAVADFCVKHMENVFSTLSPII